MERETTFYLPSLIVLIVFFVLFLYYQTNGFNIKTKDEYINVNQQLDTPLIDAFGRLRTSNPFIIFESKQLGDNDPLFWDEKLYSGSGLSSIYENSRSSTTLYNDIGATGKFIRQTYRSFDYRPGKSQLVMITANLLRKYPSSLSLPGASIGLGNYDDDNGLFFLYDNDKMYVVMRNNKIDTKISQENWNIDKMNGKGPSKIKANWDKVQIYTIDFAWLGTGRVRFCLLINGVIYPVHEFNNANNLSTVYISTPNNPLRFELSVDNVNYGVSSEIICSSVTSEGGSEIEAGTIRTRSSNNTLATPDNLTNFYLLQAFRLKENSHVTVIPKNVHYINLSTVNQAISTEWQLVFEPEYDIPIPEDSWTSVNDGNLEYFEPADGSSIVTIGTSSVILINGYSNSANNKGSGSGPDINILNKNLLLLGQGISTLTQQPIRQTMAIISKKIKDAGNNTVDVRSSLTWKEL